MTGISGRIMIFSGSFELMLLWTKYYFVLRVIISLGRVSFDDVSLFSWSLWWYLNTKSKSTQKIKIRPDVDEILKNSKTTKIFQSLKLSRWAIVSKHLRFVNQKVFTLIQKFSNFFRKNDIFIPNLEKTSNSNRWRKHFWTDFGRGFKNLILIYRLQIIVNIWYFVFSFFISPNIQKKSAPSKKSIEVTISTNAITWHHFTQILISPKPSSSAWK